MIDTPLKSKLIGRQTRRAFLKRSAAMGSLTLAAPMILRKAYADDKVLNWLTYSGHSADEVIGPFVKETGIQIRAKEYADGEKMLALIHGSPPGTFDLVTSDAPYVALLVKSNLLQPMDPADYHLDTFFPEFRHWSQHWFGDKLMALLTSWGYNGLAYNTEKLSAEDVASYEVMWSDKLKGKLGMRDWYLPVMGCISASMGYKDPYDITDAEFDDAEEAHVHAQAERRGLLGLWRCIRTHWPMAGPMSSLAAATGSRGCCSVRTIRSQAPFPRKARSCGRNRYPSSATRRIWRMPRSW